MVMLATSIADPVDLPPVVEPAAQPEQRVARPLKVLVPLIQEDLSRAEQAGLPYFRAAGEKMLEAKLSLSDKEIARGDFNAWVRENFSLGRHQARNYMLLAERMTEKEVLSRRTTTLSDILTPHRPHHQPTWHDPVKEVIARVDVEALNLQRKQMKRAEERETQRKLALQLIDIGYKVLAKTLHPDKGGSRDAMARLNAVRDQLRRLAGSKAV